MRIIDPLRRLRAFNIASQGVGMKGLLIITGSQ
jgi:hypothetical protein